MNLDHRFHPRRPDTPVGASRLALLLAGLFLSGGFAQACETPNGTFCVDYFSGRTTDGPPLLTNTENAVSHLWGSGGPGLPVPTDNFSGHWQGRFNLNSEQVNFRVVSDDGVRVKLDGSTLIDGWKNQPPTEFKLEYPITPGEHLVEIDYYEAAGDARLEAYFEPKRTCDLPVGKFCAEYYDNRTLTGNPRMTGYEPDINHVWGTASPAPNAGVPADNFSARWSGLFDFAPGAYQFFVTADDGVRIWLDDQVLVDAWSGFAGQRIEKLRWLTGQHRVMVEYFEGYNSASIVAGWAPYRTYLDEAAAPIGSNTKSSIGSNLSGWRDWSTEQPFLNLFKVSRSWITQGSGIWDTGEQAFLDLDENGWPKSLPASDSTLKFRTVTTLMLDGADLNSVRQGGEYIVLYDGEGRIDYAQGARKNTTASKPGRDVLTVDPANVAGIQLTIAVTDPNRTGNYIRNIRVVAAGKVCDDDLLAFCITDGDPACGRSACRSTEAAVNDRLFHPAFLRTLVYYKALRFMDPLATNVLGGNPPQIVEWSQRATPTKARWADQAGIPVEVAAALANQVQADAWLNMPHRASDDYIRQFARVAKASFDPSRKVYVEYANEIWNTVFSAGAWVEQQALAAWPSAPDSAYTKRINWYGKRTAEVCDIWKAEWGDQSGRVICVLGAQAANTFTANAALDCALWDKKPCQAHGIGAVAIAPYFGDYIGAPKMETTLNTWLTDPDGGLADLFGEIFTGGNLPGGATGGALAQSRVWMMNYADLAKRRGLQLLAYEGGQHLAGTGSVGSNLGVGTLFVTANKDPRMGQAYLNMLENWELAGGGLFMHYANTCASGKYGSWCLRENLSQNHTPKLDAVRSHILE